MKKILSMMGLMLVASALFVACSTDDTIDNTPVIKTMTRTIAIADTRSAVDTDGTIHFTSTEYFTPYVWTGDTYSNLITASKVLRGEEGVVTITHAIDESATSYKYGFVSPAAYKNSFDGEKYTVTLPQVQQPAADGSTYDASADVLVSQLLNIDAADTGEAATKFKRMFTFVKVTIPKAVYGGTPAADADLAIRYSSERLKAFEIKALDETPLSGVATIPATDVADDCVATFADGSSSVMATFSEDINFAAERTIWLVVNPATFTGLQMTLYTQSGEYTRTFESFECEFKPNTINKLTFKHNFANEGLERVGQDAIIVDGVRYEKTSGVEVKSSATANYGLGSLIKANALNVLFLNKSSETYDFELSNQGIIKDAVVVGNKNNVNENEKVCVKITKRNQLRNPKGFLAFKNLKIDATEMTTESMFRMATSGDDVGGINALIFEDCDIYFDIYNFFSAYGSPADSGIERIVFRNCRVIYTADEALGQLANKTPQFFAFKDITAAGAEKFKEFIVENCIFHWTNFKKAVNGNSVAGVVPFTIFNHNTSGVAFKNLNVVFNNNTLVDVVGNGSNAVLMFGGIEGERSLSSLEMTNNIVYTTFATTYPPMVALRYAAVNDWSNFVIPVNQNLAWLDGDLANTGVKTYYARDGWAFDADNNKAFKEVATATDLLPNITYDSDGVSSGTYEVGESYAGYGSTLN